MIQKVFFMDHDLYCLQKSKNLDFEDNFDRGLQ